MSSNNFRKDDRIKDISSTIWEFSAMSPKIVWENYSDKKPYTGVASEKMFKWNIPELERLAQEKNDISASAILDLIEKVKEQEEKYKKQVEELENIKIDSKKTIENLEARTKEVISDIDKRVSFWHYLIIGALLAVGIGFVLNLFDIWNYRVTYFQGYKNQVDELKKQNLILEDEVKYKMTTKEEKEILEKKISEQQAFIDNIKNCLKGKKYWEYEQCFK